MAVGASELYVCRAWAHSGGSSLDVMIIEHLLFAKHGAQSSFNPPRPPTGWESSPHFTEEKSEVP